MAEGTPVPSPVSNPFLQETLDRDHGSPPFQMPHLKRHSCPLPLVLPPAPGVSPEPGSQGASGRS